MVGRRERVDATRWRQLLTVACVITVLVIAVLSTQMVLFHNERRDEGQNAEGWVPEWNGNGAPSLGEPGETAIDGSGGSGESDGGTGEGSGGGSGEDSGEGTGDDPGEGTGEGTGDDPGEGSGEGTGDDPGEGTGDGTGDGAGDGFGEAMVIGKVTASTNGTLYLYQTAYGNYNGHGWEAAADYGKVLPDGSSYTCLTGSALQHEGLPLQTAVFSDMKIGLLPYFHIGGEGLPQSDALSEVGMEAYSVSYLYAPSYAWNTLKQRYDPYEQEEASYRRFVYDTYLELDSETREYMATIIKRYGFQSRDPDILNRVATYIRSSAVYKKDYNKELDESENMIVDFLSKYREGICVHYASAATAMFRALGIPARYMEGFTVQVTPGVETEIKAPGHAWVEVYLDGIGWVPVEVTGSSEDPSDELTLTPVTTEHKYDGNEVYPEQKLDGFAEWEKKGYRYEVEIAGSGSLPGETVTKIVSLRLYDPDGVEVTERFMLTLKTGVIHIYYDVIACVSDGRTGEYSGMPLQVRQEDCRQTSGVLLDGHRLILTPTGSITGVGTVPAQFRATIEDRDGHDITDQYKIVYDYGKLTMTARPITLKAADASKVYDGTPLTAPTYEFVEGELCEGDTPARVTVQGSQTLPGTSENIIDITTIRIYNSAGEDVTKNYMIKTEKGVLKVTF